MFPNTKKVAYKFLRKIVLHLSEFKKRFVRRLEGIFCNTRKTEERTHSQRNNGMNVCKLSSPVKKIGFAVIKLLSIKGKLRDKVHQLNSE